MFEDLITEAEKHVDRRDYAAAWEALESAHVLGQPNAWQHLRSHLWMLRLAIIERDATELLGQVVRVILSLPSSFFGLYPVGNSGRANVGLLHEP